jgi:hypothetical protein
MRHMKGLLLLAAVSGCSPSVTIDRDYDTSADFSKYKTWNWFQGPSTVTPDVDNLTLNRVRQAIEDELPRHGLARAGEGADLSAAFQLSVQRKIESTPTTVSVGYGWGPARVGVSSSPVRTYDEGTLVLDLVDSKTKTLVFRGIAKGTVKQSSSPEERENRIRDAVYYIMEAYPPKN